MRAAIYEKYGPPAVLKIDEIEKPVLKENEILVKVFAATVNRTDCARLRAKPFVMRFMTGLFKPKNPVPGTDFAGVLEAVGRVVQKFRTGDKVFGFDDNGLGSHAEYLTLPDNDAIGIIPENISFEQAAASIEGAHYARNFVNKVEIKPGQRILVNGATGAIGSAAVQIVKNMGAHVTAVCRGEDADLVKSIGADDVIDYTKTDFTKSGEKYHFVFDAVGKSTFGKCKSLLEPGGVYISSELGPWSQNLFFALFTPLFGKKKVIFPFPSDRPASVLFIKKLMAEGKFKPLIDRSHSLEEIADAFRYVETGQKKGNVVLKIASA